MSSTTIPVGFRLVSVRETYLKVFIALGFAVLTAVAAQIRIPLPFTPVPITLQTLCVLSSGLFLGAWFGLLSMAFYLALGVMGFPAFSGGASGISAVTGVTGGYLLGFLLFSYCSGRLNTAKWFRTKSLVVQLPLFYVLSFLTIFLPGVSVLKLVTGVPWVAAFTLGYLPFIPGDLVKTFLAFSFARYLEEKIKL